MSDSLNREHEQWLQRGEKRTRALCSSASAIPSWLQGLYEALTQGTIYEVLNQKRGNIPDTNSEGIPPRYSAILILLAGDPHYVPTEESPYPPDAHIILTHRTPSLRTHSGQVAFPGGGREEQDGDPIDTALREAEEEIALAPHSVQIWGCVEPVYLSRTNYVVVPVLGYWSHPGELIPSPAENDWIGHISISELCDPDQRLRVQFHDWDGPAFWVEDYLLWGFTGGVVSTLIQIAGWEQEWDLRAPVDLGEALEQSHNQEPLGALLAAMRQGHTPHTWGEGEEGTHR